MANGQNNLSQQGLIHVNEYTRRDGAQVDEHWRARSGNARTTMPANSGLVANTPDYDPAEEEAKRIEATKAFAEGIRMTINEAISLIPNVGLRNTLTEINNIGAGLQNEDFDDVIVDGPTDTETTGPVMYLKSYATKIDKLNKQTISKDNINSVMGTATNALFGDSSTLLKTVETEDPEQKQVAIDSVKNAVRSLLGLASNAKKEVVKTIQNEGIQNSEGENKSIKTYETLSELEDATYRYENLVGENLFEDAQKQANRIFELSKLFLNNS